MKLPLIVVGFLPKKYKDRYVQKQWDNKSDDSKTKRIRGEL